MSKFYDSGCETPGSLPWSVRKGHSKECEPNACVCRLGNDWKPDVVELVDIILPDDWGVEIVDEPTTYEQALDTVLAEMRELLIEHHKKYGIKNIARAGVHGLITRMNDKIARIEMDHSKCLFNECTWHGREMTDEEAEDAWLDLSCYSGPIGLMLQRNWWGLPFEKE